MSMVRESDGVERPWWAPFSVFRWSAARKPAVCTTQVTYQEFGRVLAGGVVFGVRVEVYDQNPHASATCCRQGHSRLVGLLLVADDGTLYCTPDRSINTSHVIPNSTAYVPYDQCRWVGGFATRGEVLAYLRAHDHIADKAWSEAQYQYPHA
jgi:hypothetical protein